MNTNPNCQCNHCTCETLDSTCYYCTDIPCNHCQAIREMVDAVGIRTQIQTESVAFDLDRSLAYDLYGSEENGSDWVRTSGERGDANRFGRPLRVDTAWTNVYYGRS